MRVAQIVPSLEHRHGGPSKSVRALANALSGIGESVDLLTTHECPAPLEGDAATVRVFPRVFPAFACRSPDLARQLDAGSYDCIHHHSLWLLTLRYAQTASNRCGAPLVVSPRGMMSDWAWNHRRWRKRLAEFFIHPGAFEAAAGWHATGNGEADEIRKLGFTQPICVAPNGTDVPTQAEREAAGKFWRESCPTQAGRRIALFYSRFHRKKRLRELVDLWIGEARGDWDLWIVGLPEEYSLAEIQSWIDGADAAGRVRVFDGSNKPPPYAAASLFVLPTHSENFGLVIAEALAHGVPVLVTDTTPWRALDDHEAGWCISWQEFPKKLAAVLSMPETELLQRGARGRDWVAREFSWTKSAALLKEFYGSLSNA